MPKTKKYKDKDKNKDKVDRSRFTRKNNFSRVVSSTIKNISFEKACSDFRALKNIDFSSKKNTVLHSAKVGNSAMDYYFFKYRLHTKIKRGISYYEWIKTNWKQNESEYRMYKFNLAQGKNHEQARYGVFRLYYGSSQGFKPLIAKWLYSLYQPKTAVLDFSAGWGGRCLAAMAYNVPYIGIDTNIELKSVYRKMVSEISKAEASEFDVTMIFKDAATVRYEDYKYDMVFTSPPYFKSLRLAEVYPHMPLYSTRQDFNTKFLFPVIQNSYKHLKHGGTFAINVPIDAFDDIRNAKIMPPRVSAKHKLFIQPRFAKGNPVNPEKKYNEYIYVWKKP
jgi:tRNA1(Val) A37 N6-methylase TrmN6